MLLLLIFGAIVGWIGSRLMRTTLAPWQAAALGAAGALAGWVAVRVVFAVLSGLALLVGAAVGALLALWLWRRLSER